jgi:protein-arginine deiminase
MGGDGVGGYFLRSEPDEPWDDSLTGDSNDDFINVPVLYFGEAPSDRSVGAFIPNLVNGQPVSGSEFVLPKPYGPRSVSGATDCLFETAISLLLPPATFVDDWESYHREEGEVHCGTAAVREIPPTPWWSVNP